MIKTNYHTHSNYFHGKAPLREYVLEAIRNNFKSIGFTSHSPISDNNGVSINHADVPAYYDEVNALKYEFAKQIEILLSFEFEYIPNLTRPIKDVAKQWNLDYILGSVHLVVGKDPAQTVEDLWFTDGPDITHYDQGLLKFFDGDIRKAVKAFYYQTNLMIENLDIIGHFDKIKMNNKDRYFQRCSCTTRFRFVLGRNL